MFAIDPLLFDATVLLILNSLIVKQNAAPEAESDKLLLYVTKLSK